MVVGVVVFDPGTPKSPGPSWQRLRGLDQVTEPLLEVTALVHLACRETERQRDRQTDRQTDRERESSLLVL